nr:hypothetical protein GCM10020063_019850 [Dactylosporangium thailandense]
MQQLPGIRPQARGQGAPRPRGAHAPQGGGEGHGGPHPRVHGEQAERARDPYRVALVEPPDGPARESILRYHLRDRPIARIDLARLIPDTADISGADLAHLCETAAEFAIEDSIERGEVRPIEQRDLERALKEVRPSTGPWFAAARNVAMFANEGGAYDDLVRYLKSRKMLS